jgi:DNA-binding response OmpR family regulator
VKVKSLSLLIIDEDKDMRQELAAFVGERYRSVTAAAPEEVGSLIALESFDVMITPRIGINFSANDPADSRVAEGVTSVAAVRSGLTGNTYEFRSLNQGASSWVINPFERVLLQVAIENSELSLRQLKRIMENDAVS